jgi:hypothetical protein
MVKITDLDALTRVALLELARVRGVQLPAKGYVSKPELVALLSAAAIERKREPRKRRGR